MSEFPTFKNIPCPLCHTFGHIDFETADKHAKARLQVIQAQHVASERTRYAEQADNRAREHMRRYDAIRKQLRRTVTFVKHARQAAAPSQFALYHQLLDRLCATLRIPGAQDFNGAVEWVRERLDDSENWKTMLIELAEPGSVKPTDDAYTVYSKIRTQLAERKERP